MNIIQALEQFAATLRDVAPVLAQYRKDLEKQGFSKEEAFYLTVRVQGIMFGQKGE